MYDIVIFSDGETKIGPFTDLVITTLRMFLNFTLMLAVKIVAEMIHSGSALVHSSCDLNECVVIRDTLLSNGIHTEIKIIDCSITKKR